MNKTHVIIYIAVFLAMILPLQSCSDRGKQSELQKYSDLYVHYCRKGLFDSLAIDAGKVFAARNGDLDRRLVLLSGLHSAQAAIFQDDYPGAKAYLDTLAGFDYPAALAHLTDAFN